MSGPLGGTHERVWAPFLTPQDRAFVERIGDLSPRRFGSSPALLMIDHCNYAIGRERVPLLESMQRHPMSCGLAAWEAVERTHELLTACRAADIPVVHSVPYGFEPNSPRRRSGGLSDIAPDEAWDREIIAELAPAGTEVVLPKLGASSFAGTPLDALLRRWGIDTVIMTGNTTSGCVRATAIDAAYLQFSGFVVEDCVYDRTEAAHAMNLFDMHYKYADVVGLQEMLQRIADR